MNKKIAIIQSNYIPWTGYFGIIQQCDTFIFLDDVQYTRRDWRNRNKIKTPQGLQWLTIPVATKGKYADVRVCEVGIPDDSWKNSHLNQIKQYYRHAPYFADIFPWLEISYEEIEHFRLLSEVNQHLIRKCCAKLGITTQFACSTDFFTLSELSNFSSSERLLKLCISAGGNCYLSGPAAKEYLDVALFAEDKVEVEWMDYSHYQPYRQLHGEFSLGVSIIDTLMMLGTEAGNYVKYGYHKPENQ